jgi:hypothetical protein
MNKIKSGKAIVCEYVAQGSHGKHTLVNAYSGDILVQDLPAAIPLAFFIELEFEGAGGNSQLKVNVLLGGKSKAQAEAEIQVESGKPGILVLQQAAFQIDGATDIKVTMSMDGARAITLVRKTISQGNIPGLTVPTA